MQAVIIIPARLESARLPRKLLLPVHGKPLLWWTWNAATEVKSASAVIVATDSDEIERAVTKWGGRAVRTSPHHQNGTSRIAEVAGKLSVDTKLAINLQGDEPAIKPAYLDQLIEFMNQSREYQVGTLAAPLAPDDATLNNVVKVAVSGTRALYFSRTPMAGAMRHVGVYAYWTRYLSMLNSARPSPLAVAEKLEQLTCLELGWLIGASKIDCHTISVDTRDDYDRFCEFVEDRRQSVCKTPRKAAVHPPRTNNRHKGKGKRRPGGSK